MKSESITCKRFIIWTMYYTDYPTLVNGLPKATLYNEQTTVYLSQC